MKDILFEKYREILDKDIIEIEPYLFYAAVACANTTKEMMKGFLQWRESLGLVKEGNSERWLINYAMNEMSLFANNDDELLEKYLETLNQK